MSVLACLEFGVLPWLEPLRNAPERFGAVTLDEFGHSIRWVDDQGDDVDFGSEALRRRAERQAEILRLAS